jgi:hypothetical protein
MEQFTFITIIVVILVLLKIFQPNEKFESDNKHAGIYNHFYQQVLNPYEYPMIPFFSNDSQELPKPSPPNPKI